MGDEADPSPKPKRASWSGGWGTLRDFEVFQAAMEARQTVAAAKALGISQPAVSRTLAQIETRIGRLLFTREGSGLVPNADAHALAEDVQVLFRALNRVNNFSLSEPRGGTLRLVTTPTLAHCLVDGVAAQFLARYPGLAVHMEIVTTPHVVEHVVDGRADVGIADVQPRENPHTLQRFLFRRSHFACAMTQDHPLARRERIVPADLDGQPLIALVRRNTARVQIDKVFARTHCAPVIVAETSNALSAANYVAAGAGLSLVSGFPLMLRNDHKLCFRIFEPKITSECAIFVAGHGGNQAVAMRFVEFLRQVPIANDQFSTAIEQAKPSSP